MRLAGPTQRWDMAWFQPVAPDFPLDVPAMRGMLSWLATEGPAHGPDRIQLEPPLEARLGGRSSGIRFQGCRAERHDDHVHIQVR